VRADQTVLRLGVDHYRVIDGADAGHRDLLSFSLIMTSPERGLHPASSNNRATLLSALELVACGGVQLAEVVGAIVGQGMAFKQGPQVLHRVQVGRVRGQECNLNVPTQTVQIVPHQASSNLFHVYTVCRATPTAIADSAGVFPASNIRPARGRFFAALLNLFWTMTTFSSNRPEDITPMACRDKPLSKCATSATTDNVGTNVVNDPCRYSVHSPHSTISLLAG